jgi:hypothetical protein
VRGRCSSWSCGSSFVLSLSSAFLGLEHWATIARFGVAAMQTAILFILHAPERTAVIEWIFAVTGFVWLLFSLSMTDYTDRRVYQPHGPSFQKL